MILGIDEVGCWLRMRLLVIDGDTVEGLVGKVALCEKSTQWKLGAF
jgi:hypothetical protein